MSSDNSQNPEQPDEFEDLENENAPNQDPAPATTPPEPAPTPAPTPVPASPQPEPTPPDQSPQPADKADPAEIQKKETKSLQEQLEQLREERKNQEVVISKLAEANTGLQKKFDSAEKQHKVQQENAVEVATKAAVGQATRERDAARTERDRTRRRNVRILAAVIVLLSVGLLSLAAHDFLFESTSSPAKPATQQPAAASGQNTPTATNEKEEDPILKRIKALTKPNPNAKTNK